MSDLAEVKRGARATWAAGEFDAVAELIWDVGQRLVERLEIGPGERVLDVGAGTGNAAVPAAAAGASVTASDLTPELFGPGRERAAAAGVELDWVEADAEALPFEDGSFDVVVSTFGHMFAPRHRVTAEEIARVLAPGGRLGLCCWTPEGNIGSFFATIRGHAPPPPEIVEPPPLWGSPEHASEMFEGTGVELEFEREVTTMEFTAADEATDFYAEKFGPIVMARAALEPEGKWEALRSDLIELFEQRSEPDGDGLSFPAQYLVILGRKSG